MTLQLGERITISKLIEKLQTVQFDELTYEKCEELFTGHNLQGLSDIKFDLKDLFIDDYVFSIYKLSDDEYKIDFNGFKINSTIKIIDYVEVWLPSDNNGSNDIQAEGIIKHSNSSFYLEVTYKID